VAATAIVVLFREVDPVVGRYRRELTGDGADGMPAHVTLIYPFADDSHVGIPEIGRLRAALAGFSAFDVTFPRFGRFAAVPPVLYLEPEPAGAFVDMIAALTREFPAFPPFGGMHATVVPHLTVAQTDDMAAMRAAEDGVARHLPIRTGVAEATLMEHRGDGWRPRERIPLPAAE
jgi:2'-5' RNA ligase